MVISALVIAGALAGWLTAPQFAWDLVCSAADNLPCRPLTLECLFAGAGGLAAGLPAVPPGWGGFPTPGSDTDDDQSRPYAPDPPSGYRPPPPPSPQDALADPEFQRLQDQWARDNAGRFPTVRGEGDGGMSAADILVESIRSSGRR